MRIQPGAVPPDWAEPVPPVDPIIAVKSETVSEFASRMQAAALAQLARPGEQLKDLQPAHLQHIQSPDGDRTRIFIAGPGAQCFHADSSDGDRMRELLDERVRHQHVSPLSSEVPEIMRALNEYYIRSQGGLFGAVGPIAQFFTWMGIAAESALPVGKRRGSLTPEAFIKDTPKELTDTYGSQYRIERELFVAGSLELGQGGFRELRDKAAELSTYGLAVHILQHPELQKPPNFTCRFSSWVPVTIADQLRTLPKKVAEALVLAANLKLEVPGKST